jgi:hypothetical protein
MGWRIWSALAFAGAWSTGAPQQPGMWFQIELPEPATISEVQFTSPGGGFGGGGRGRGGRGATPLQGTGAAPIAGSQAPAAPSAMPGLPMPVVTGGTYPRAYRVEVSTKGTVWSTVSEGQGDDHRVHAGGCEVRANHADSNGGKRAIVVDTTPPALSSGRRWKGAIIECF